MESGKAVYNILTNDSALANIVGSKIYPEIAPQDIVQPYVTYSVEISDPSPTKSASSSLDEQRVRVYGVSANYSECMDIGIAVRAALDRNGGPFAGVQVQSIDFESADVVWDDGHKSYVIEHIYMMRILRVGNATAANIASTTTIYQAKSLQIRSEFLHGGATPQDFNSNTPQVVQFSSEYQSTGTDITLTAGYILKVAASGWYRISYGVDFVNDTTGGQPSIYAQVESRILPVEASGYLPGGTTPNLGTVGVNASRIEYLTANDRVKVMGYDRSNASQTINMSGGYFIVERIA